MKARITEARPRPATRYTVARARPGSQFTTTNRKKARRCYLAIGNQLVEDAAAKVERARRQEAEETDRRNSEAARRESCIFDIF